MLTVRDLVTPLVLPGCRSAGAQGAVAEAHQQDGAAVGVVLGVEEQRPQWLLRVALGRGQVLDDRLQQVVDAVPSLAETWIEANGSSPRSRSISSITRSTAADGRSILLITDTTSSPNSMAR